MRHPALAASLTVVVACLAACGPVAEAEAEASNAVDLENERQRASYAIGQANGTGLAQEFGDKVDIDAFIAGVVSIHYVEELSACFLPLCSKFVQSRRSLRCNL